MNDIQELLNIASEGLDVFSLFLSQKMSKHIGGKRTTRGGNKNRPEEAKGIHKEQGGCKKFCP